MDHTPSCFVAVSGHFKFKNRRRLGNHRHPDFNTRYTANALEDTAAV